MNAAPHHEPAAPDENLLITERREKLAAIRAQGVAFPNDFKPAHHAADLHHQHDQVPNEELEPRAIAVAVAGRLMLKRVMGKACFGTLQDGTGRIQVYVTLDAVVSRRWPPSSSSTWATSSAAPARCFAPRPASCRSAPRRCGC